MKPEQIDELLKRTLDDHKVSRGEKKILDGIVREHGSAANQLAFLRHRAFDMAREQLMSPDAKGCLLYTSPSPRDRQKSRMPSSA